MKSAFLVDWISRLRNGGLTGKETVYSLETDRLSIGSPDRKVLDLLVLDEYVWPFLLHFSYLRSLLFRGTDLTTEYLGERKRTESLYYEDPYRTTVSLWEIPGKDTKDIETNSLFFRFFETWTSFPPIRLCLFHTYFE